MSFRPLLTKSAAPAKKAPKPVDKMARDHPMLTDTSPLTRQVCAAANLPDVQALLVALAHPMTDEDQAALAKRAGGHPAHATRIKHLRELALKQHGDPTQAEETTEKGFPHGDLAKGMLPRYYGTKNPETGKKHQGKVEYGDIKHPGSRGGHWFVNGAGHIEYGEKPAPFRALADFDHDDAHEKAAYEQVLHEAGIDENVGNHLVFSTEGDRSRMAAQAAADLGNHRAAPAIKRVLDYHHADVTKQFREHPLHRGVSDNGKREHQPIDPTDLHRALQAWRACSVEEHKGGEIWYETARACARKWSHESGYSYLRCAAVIALTSQENPWDLNLKQAEYGIFGKLAFGDNERTWEHKYSSVREKVRAVLHERYPTRYVTGDKIRSFFMNIIGVGNGRVVTIDRHMYAIMGAEKNNQKSSDYNYYRRVYIAAAHHVGVPPDVFQAATWAWYANGPAKDKARANGQPERLIGTGNTDTTLAKLRQHIDSEASAAKSFRSHLASRHDNVYSEGMGKSERVQAPGQETLEKAARVIKNPGSRGGVGYWDGKGNWRYGVRPVGRPAGTPPQQPAAAQSGSPQGSSAETADPHAPARSLLKRLLSPSSPAIDESKQRLQQHGYILKEDAGLLSKPTKEREQTLKNVEEAVAFVHATIPGLSDLVKAQGLHLTINTTPVKGPDISGKYSVNPLTKRKGITIRQDSGQTFFHEIGHFIDNSLQGGQDEKILGMGLPFASQRKGSSAQKVVAAVQKNKSVKTFMDEGEKRNGELYRDYLSQEPEIFARAFNAFLAHEYTKKTGTQAAGERIGEDFTPQEMSAIGRQMTSLLKQANYKSFRAFYDAISKGSRVQAPGSRGGKGYYTDRGEWVYGQRPTEQAPEASRLPQEATGHEAGPSGPPASSEPVANPWVRSVAEAYVRKAGIADALPERPYAKLDTALSHKIADAYEAAEHNPKDPAVARSYAALAKEVKAQYEHALASGMRFVPWGKDSDPYKTSAEMREDVLKNKHLGFYQGGSLPEDHPMAQIDPDHGLSVNDQFRAIHDLYGHAQGGFGFHARGEDNAYREHKRMFSKEAIPALTSETRAQNSVVNYGSHLRRPDGTVPKKGEEGYIAPADRPFADQKAVVLPAWAADEGAAK